MSHWWASVVGVAAYWLLGDDAHAQELYPRVKAMPQFLQTLQDPLPRAVLAAFRYVSTLTEYGTIIANDGSMY